MSYQFAGFFVKDFRIPDTAVADGDTLRVIEAPFRGSSIRIEKYLDQDPSLEEIRQIASQLGFKDDLDWMFLVYECWGGRIDYLYGFIHKPNVEYGPVKESSRDHVEDAYIRFMNEFGVSKEDSLHFGPFERGFWGE